MYLYKAGNYILADDGTNLYQIPVDVSAYQEHPETLTVFQRNAQQRSQVVIPIADVANWDKDAVGGRYADADELRAFLQDNTGKRFSEGGGGGLTSVATDATLTGDGTAGAPLSVVPGADNYAERWDTFSSAVSGVWNTITLPGSPANRTVFITIDPNVNNRTVGVREVGSSLNRTARGDNDSHMAFMVKTNAAGEIEIFTSGNGPVFQVQSYLN